MQEKLRYSDLTPFQQKVITNGCGASNSLFNPPEFKFKASCNQHDFYYWRGGNEDDRKLADKQFYDAMVEDSKLCSNIFSKTTHLITAKIYYVSVSLFGKKHFYYTDKPRGMKEVLELVELERIRIKGDRKS